MSQISPGLNTVPKEHPQLPGRGGCSQRGCAVGVPRDVGHRRERPESRRRKVFSRVKKKYQRKENKESCGQTAMLYRKQRWHGWVIEIGQTGELGKEEN